MFIKNVSLLHLVKNYKYRIQLQYCLYSVENLHCAIDCPFITNSSGNSIKADSVKYSMLVD